MGAILREGFEAGGVEETGWIRPTSNGHLPVVTSGSGILPRKDFNGNGGSYFALESGNADSAKALSREAEEIFVRISVATPNLTNNNSEMSFYGPGGGRHARMRCDGSPEYDIRTAGNFVRGNSSAVLVANTEWQTLQIRLLVANSGGYYRLYKDFDYGTPSFVYTGDTRDNTGSTDSVDEFRLNFDTQGVTAYDDVAINDITISYTGGSGTIPAIGDSILGQTSSARAVITNLLPGSTAASGTLQLKLVQDSGLVEWSGVITDDPFTTETIDDSLSSNLWTASITGLDKNSGFPTDGYIIGLSPNGDVAGKIQLTNTVGPSNYEDVDEIPSNDSDYVFTATTGDRDVYELANFPIAAGNINDISSVTLSSKWIRTDSVITKGRLIMEHSTVEYETDQKALPLSFSGDTEIYDKVPDGTDWNITKLDAIRVGVKFET